MDEPDVRLSRVIAAHAGIGAGLSFAHSLRARGLRRSLLFAACGPLGVVLGWYTVADGTFAIVEGRLPGLVADEDRWGRLLAPGTALVATSLDLVLDCFGLERGLWEWSIDGPYAAEIRGPNGKRGIPLLNFAGWLALISGVVLAYRSLTPGDAGRPGSVRTAALLPLSYYLPAAAWAIRRRKWKYLLRSALFPVALAAALYRGDG